MNATTFLLSTELRELQFEALQRDGAEHAPPSKTIPVTGLHSPAGDAPTHLLSQLADGRWQASVRCPRCGAMSGWIGALAQCQGLIDRNQRHIAECGGIPTPPPFARVEHCTCCGSWRGPRDAETEVRGA